ncbi:conserved hypothetical protein [Thiomonas sp. CB3]|nr:conserved hypothetical protein [Thiomonas sp. CB3]
MSHHHVVVSMDHQAWQAGYAAGLAGKSSINPPELDGLAFSSGYIEGKAHRQGFDQAGREKQERLDVQQAKPC